MKKRFIWILIVVLAVAVIRGCLKGAGHAKSKDQTVPVRVMKVKLEDLQKALEYVGNIKGQDEAVVYPKVSGKVIEKVKEEGSFVKKGDPIAYIDRDEVGLKFEKSPVESPLDGTVGRVYVDIGSNVTPTTAVALVAKTGMVEIALDIPEKYLPRISLGQSAIVTVDAYPKEKFMGNVTKISPVVDLMTRGAPIEISLDNTDGRLQSGMFAKVKLVIEDRKGVPVILKEAVIGKDPDTYIYTVEGKKAILKKVKLGIRQGPYFEVAEGLKEGEPVVIMGQQRLRDGITVAPEE